MKNSITFFIGLILILNVQAQTSPFYHLMDTNYFGGFRGYGLEGPDAPDIQVSNEGGGVRIDLNNSILSNNQNESYWAIDTSIQSIDNGFLFQGYIIYQATKTVVGPFDSYFDTTKMRVVAQSDLADNIDTLTNRYLDTLTGKCDSALMVQGNNQGVKYSYLLKTDAFTGSAFQNGNTYCYYVFSYAHNGKKIGKDCKEKWPFLIGKKLSNGSGQGAGKCITFNSTSVDELSNNLNLSYNPNPTEKYVNITLEERMKRVNIKVTNVQGQELLRKEVYDIQEIKLDLERFSKGIYFAQILTDKGRRTIKFVRE